MPNRSTSRLQNSYSAAIIKPLMMIYDFWCCMLGVFSHALMLNMLVWCANSYHQVFYSRQKGCLLEYSKQKSKLRTKIWACVANLLFVHTFVSECNPKNSLLVALGDFQHAADLAHHISKHEQEKETDTWVEAPCLHFRLSPAPRGSRAVITALPVNDESPGSNRIWDISCVSLYMPFFSRCNILFLRTFSLCTHTWVVDMKKNINHILYDR